MVIYEILFCGSIHSVFISLVCVYVDKIFPVSVIAPNATMVVYEI